MGKWLARVLAVVLSILLMLAFGGSNQLLWLAARRTDQGDIAAIFVYLTVCILLVGVTYANYRPVNLEIREREIVDADDEFSGSDELTDSLEDIMENSGSGGSDSCDSAQGV